jgi:AcrR family transcriptional regulator
MLGNRITNHCIISLPKMPTQAERNQATREALLHAGRELFAERGYTDVSVQSVATRAGVTTGALYHQFGSKQALFTAVYSELVEQVWVRVLKTRDNTANPTLVGDCEAYLDACADPAFNRITIDGPAVIGWDTILADTQTMIQASLTDAHERGEVSAPPTPALARMIAAALKEAAVLIARSRDPAAERAAARVGAAQLINGLLRS